MTITGARAEAIDAADRHLRDELEGARDVQARLFPRVSSELETLDYGGQCIQARAVGGDYYDFLEPGSGGVGIVLGDVSGKGLPAALLMASLQAHLRSHYSIASDDLPSLLEAVNRQFGRSIASSRFATLFLGHYDDHARRMRYVNCGHLPPVLLRAGGTVERLASTALVLGAFPEWEGTVGEVSLAPGDTLALFSDGVTEARNLHGEEFGDRGVLGVLRANRHRPVMEVASNLLAAVWGFQGRGQPDDMTVVIARGRVTRAMAQRPVDGEACQKIA